MNSVIENEREVTLKHTQYPVAKPLSLAVAAALTSLGLAMTLAAPARADVTVSTSQSSGITNTTTENITITGSNVTVTSSSHGVYNNQSSSSAIIGVLDNNGTIISGSAYAGIYNNSGTISTINNTGFISGGSIAGVGNYLGIISTINNSGTIIGNAASLNSNQAVYNDGGTIGQLINSGTISQIIGSNSRQAITNSAVGTIGGTIGILNNSNLIVGHWTGVLNNSSSTIGTIINSGTITGNAYYGIKNFGMIGTIDNAGKISAGGVGIRNYNASAVINSLINTGTIMNSVSNAGTILSLNNNGSISGGVGNSDIISQFYNSGSVSGGISNSGTIVSLANNGSIVGSISNTGTITTLTNSQLSLAYSGRVPSNYNTYFTSSSHYGTTVFTNPSGSIASYGIQLASSGVTLVNGHVYTGVLSSSTAFTVANANTVLTYASNGYSVTYELVAGIGHSYNLDILSFNCSGSCNGNPISPAVMARHNNPAYYAAQLIDANSTLSTLFSGVSGTTAQSAAASQSLPLVTGGATSVSQTALTSVNTIINARQSANRGASSGDDFQTNRNMWLKAFGTEADQSDLDGVSGFKAHTGGVTFGADEKVTDKLTLGAAFAYANSNVSSTVGGASQGINIKGYQLIGYGSLALNNRDSVDFQLDGGMSNNSGSRNISFLNEVANSSYNSWTAHLGSSLNRRYDLSDRLTLTPSLRVDYTRINESGYQESGAGDLDLNVNSQRAEALVFGVDGKLDYKLSDTLAVAANLGLGYDAMNKQDSIVAAYAGAPNASFITEGLNQGALISRAGAVLSYKLPKGMEISAHYDVEGRRNYLSQTASVKFSMPF